MGGGRQGRRMWSGPGRESDPIRKGWEGRTCWHPLHGGVGPLGLHLADYVCSRALPPPVEIVVEVSAAALILELRAVSVAPPSAHLGDRNCLPSSPRLGLNIADIYVGGVKGKGCLTTPSREVEPWAMAGDWSWWAIGEGAEAAHSPTDRQKSTGEHPTPGPCCARQRVGLSRGSSKAGGEETDGAARQ